MTLHVVLHEPEIPQNTGNIARTCAAAGASLHLIEPLGFSIDDRYLKRAGLDYWHLVEVKIYPDLGAYFAETTDFQRIFATKKAGVPYTDMMYEKRCSLIFGKETTGLHEKLLSSYPDSCVRIPMRAESRSLNLSNAAAIIIYETLRRNGFAGLATADPDLRELC